MACFVINVSFYVIIIILYFETIIKYLHFKEVSFAGGIRQILRFLDLDGIKIENNYDTMLF